MKIYCIDIDNTIFISDYPDYNVVGVNREIIDKVNKLYDEGNYIKIFTARGSGTGRDFSEYTHKQLLKYCVKFHELIFGKPVADHYIDDRSMTFEEFLK